MFQRSTQGTGKERCSDRGAAIAEFSMILPLFLFIAAVVIDFGVMLNQYYTLSRVVYSSARLATDFPQLDVGSVTNANPYQGAHYNLQDRIRKLLYAYGYGDTIKVDIDVTTSRISQSVTVSTSGTSMASDGADTQYNNDIARVVLKMNYKSIWSEALGLDNIPITVESEGAYLHR